jgi:hypothetical protein
MEMYGAYTPMRNKGFLWVLYTVVQVVFVWVAIEVYKSQNSNGYRAGAWALVICIPIVLVPVVGGLILVYDAIMRRWNVSLRRRWHVSLGPTHHSSSTYSQPIPPPPCDICNTNPCSWNARTNTWAETCSSCRNPTYFDNGYMIG